MNMRILAARERIKRQQLSAMASKLTFGTMAVMKAKKAFKRQAKSEDLTIRAQLVSSHDSEHDKLRPSRYMTQNANYDALAKQPRVCVLPCEVLL
jgi:hypothetical protein